jgi:hypothetical protein
MNRFQEAWWQQARSDHDVFVTLRRQGAAACHQLHYLQMVTEKLSKAYFWRSGKPPPMSHAGFAQFMRFLGGVRQAERQQIAEVFAFSRFEDFQRWVRTVLPLAYELERLAPDLAQDGPNPEYPWPQLAPTFFPAGFQFEIWRQLVTTGRGRQLIQVIRYAVERFPIFA